MNFYSFNEEKILNDYNKLVELYYNTNSEDGKIRIYNNLKSLSKYIMNKKIKIKEPFGYREYFLERRNNVVKSLINLDELTRELSYYWLDCLQEIPSSYGSFLSSDIISKEQYFRTITAFISNNFPDDLDLVKKTFREERINVKKSFVLSRSEIFLFEMLNTFYIKITLNRNLSIKEVADTIHEFGHASEFINRTSPYIKENVLKETVSTLFEVKFIDDYFRNNLELRNLELVHLFKTVGQVNYLNAAFVYNQNKEDVYKNYADIVNRLYAHIISLTLLNQDDFTSKVKYINQYSSSIEPIELLRKIGIKEEDLITIAKNSRKLLLTKS